MAKFASPLLGDLNSGVNAAGNTLIDTRYRVICAIEIYNWTNQRLTYPRIRIAGGEVEINPKDILPGKKEIMVARKTAYTPTGSYGTVSWLIEGKNRLLVVMWIAPFNFDFHENWLAVGITREGVTEHEIGNKWYEQMYKGTSSSLLRFRRMKYEKDVETVIYEEDGIRISGTMSTGHQAHWQFFVYTLAVADMATFASPLLGALNSGVNAVANSLMDTMYRVICAIEIYNWTNQLLSDPEVRIAGGEVEIPPKDILPGEKEIMVARKTAYTPTGSYGTVSWLIEGKKRRIVVMWIAPFNFDFHENWLAVGITGEGVTEHKKGKKWYEQMYKGTSSSSLKFSRIKYEKDIETVIHEEDGIRISGRMSTGHQAHVMITVRPVDISASCPRIKEHFSEP